MKIAVIAGLSDKKLLQKLVPLEQLDSVSKIELFRREKLESAKTTWIKIPNIIAKNLFFAEIYRFLAFIAKAKKYDLIIGCNQVPHGIMAWLVGKLFSKPVVQIITTDVDLVFKNIFARKAVMSSAVCAVRGAVSVEKIKKHGYRGYVEILANEYPYIEVPKEKPEKKYDLIFVAHRPASAKDFPWLMTVLSELKNKTPNFKILIVGEGHEKNLSQAVKDLQLENNVLFSGMLEEKELRQKYLESKIMILTSKLEGLPMVVIEALSLGIPMVVTNVGDIPWLIQNGKEGFLVNNGDTENMVSRIYQLLTERTLYEQFCKNARQRFEELIPSFQADKISETWEHIINVAVFKNKNSDIP